MPQNNSTATVTLHVNGRPVEQELDQIRKKLDEVRARRVEAFSMGDTKGLRELDKEYARVAKQLRQIEGDQRTFNRTLSALDAAKPRELQRTIKLLNESLNSSAVERGSKEWNALQQQLKKAREELEKIKKANGAMEKDDGAAVKLGKNWVGVTTILAQARAAYDALMGRVMGYVEQYAAHDQAMVNVQKYTGLARTEVEAMQQDLARIDTSTPRERLNALAADAGRLGLTSRRDVLDFVEAADTINVALGEDLGEDAVKNIGKLADIFGDSQRMGLRQAMLSTGSAINELAQSSSASEPYILEFTTRLAATGRTAGLTQAQIMGLAAGFDQSGMQVERAATALTNVLSRLMQAPAAAARTARLDVKAFTDLLKRDANAALLEFARGMGQYDSLSMSAALKDLKISGAGVSDALKLLASDTDRFSQAQTLATQAFADGTSVAREAAAQNASVAARLQRARNEAAALAAELGEHLLPVVTSGMGVARTLLALVVQLIAWSRQHAAAVAAVTVAVAAWTAALLYNTIAHKAHIVATRAGAVAQAAWATAVAAARVVTLLFTGQLAKARAAFLALNLVMRANVFGIIVTVATALALVVARLVSHTSSLTEAQRRQIAAARDWHEVMNKMREATGGEISRIRMLDAVMRDNNRTMGDRQRAAAALNRIIPQYNAQLDASTGKVRANTDALEAHIKALKRAALARATQDRLTGLASEELDSEQSRARRATALRIRRDRLSAAIAALPEEQRELAEYIAGGGRWNKATTNGRYHTTTGGFMKMRRQLEPLMDSIAQAETWVNEADSTLGDIHSRQTSLMRTASRLGLTVDALTADTAGSGASAGDTGGSGAGSGTQTYTPAATTAATAASERAASERTEAIKKIEAQQRREQAEAAVQYVAGEIKTWEEYRERLYTIDTDALERRRALYREGSTELLDIDKDAAELATRYDKERVDLSLTTIDEEFAARRRALELQQTDETADTEAHQAALDALELEHLRRRRDYLRQPQNHGTPEDVRAAERALAEAEARQKFEREKAQQKKLASLRAEYLEKSAEDRYAAELAALDALHKAGLMKEEEYQQMLAALRRKYHGDGSATDTGGAIGSSRARAADRALEQAGWNDKQRATSAGGSGLGGAVGQLGTALKEVQLARQAQAQLKQLYEQGKIDYQQYADAKDRIAKGHYDRVQAVAAAAYAAVSAITSSASQLVQANASLEEARVTARYDKEIEAAGSATARGRKLEEQKQKELAAIKTKYNKRAMAIEIAQALAETAYNAIVAYGSVAKIPIVGPALGIAAAAAATAAGMIQVAAIKKQHDAEAAGYYAGGFTAPGDPRREAGVVHRGEFVANHRAVGNAALLPLFRLVDHAQKTNTVASLTAADVSRALGTAPAAASPAGSTAATAPVVVQAGPDDATRATLERLAAQLDEGIRATVVIDGPDGFERQYRQYQRLRSRA